MQQLPSKIAPANIMDRTDTLVFYRAIASHPAFRLLRTCLEKAGESQAGETQGGDTQAGKAPSAAGLYTAFLHELASAKVTAGLPGQAWQKLLLHLILFDENPFTLACERKAAAAELFPAVAHDLHILADWYLLDLTSLEPAEPALMPAVKPWEEERLCAADPLFAEVVTTAAQAAAWRDGRLAAILAAFHQRWGSGRMAAYAAFRWQDGHLLGIPQPDPIRLEHLHSYEAERQVVLKNTERFLSGLPADNILLYGDRGTGKSATVKALLWRYAAAGLRLVELPDRHLSDIWQVFSLLSERGHKFLLFIDDLSFEAGDTGYKPLKAALEGSLAARPANVLVYATSNRRHLIRELASDRSGAETTGGARRLSEEDMRPADTVHEKLSLSDRFARTVIFPTPDQEEFLTIVRQMAARFHLNLAEERLRERALQWALWHNGRTPRAARQFIDDLRAELAELGQVGETEVPR